MRIKSTYQSNFSRSMPRIREVPTIIKGEEKIEERVRGGIF
jgi:hypothetical protein